MQQRDGAIALMPYVLLDKPLTVGEFVFLPLEQALQTEPVRSEEKALRNTLSVFKHGKSAVTTGVVVLLSDAQAIGRFHDALLAFKFASLSVPQHIVRLCSEHFEVVFHRLGTPDSGFIALEEGRHLTAGRAEDMVRTLPGPLKPERILTQWLPLVADRSLPDALVTAFQETDGQLIERAITWFCRAFRWGNDPTENVVDLVTALQVLVPVPQNKSKHKYDLLSSSLGSLTVSNADQRHWIGAACLLRNKILHEGSAPKSDFVHTDEQGHAILPHEVIAREFLVEAVKNKVSGAMPEDELYSAVIAAIRESKFRSLIRSNKARLDALLDLTRNPLSFDTILQARQLASIDAQDFSLTADDCSLYEQSLAACLEMVRSIDQTETELTKLRRNIQNARRVLEEFKMNLEAGIFRLP